MANPNVKFVEQKKIRLRAHVLYQGGAYFAGQTLSVDEDTAAKWLAEGVAELVPAEAPKPAPAAPASKDKQDK